MLTITALRDPEYLISSVALGLDEYYAGVGEAPGVWSGRFAAELGLVGVVDADHLRSLVDGHSPLTGENLLAGRPVRSINAFDATFSAPLSRCRDKGAYAERVIMPSRRAVIVIVPRQASSAPE